MTDLTDEGRCPSYWGNQARRCLLNRGHDVPHSFPPIEGGLYGRPIEPGITPDLRVPRRIFPPSERDIDRRHEDARAIFSAIYSRDTPLHVTTRPAAAFKAILEGLKDDGE